jgi:hypothetical protein
MKAAMKWTLMAACVSVVLGAAYLVYAADDTTKAPAAVKVEAQVVGKADTQVVIGKAGKKYHVDGCKQLNDTATKIALGEAVVKGYTPCGSCNPPVLMVYVTKSGKSYHNDGCGALTDSKTAIPFVDAVAKGYAPCKKCNPPAMPAADTGAASGKDAEKKATDKK